MLVKPDGRALRELAALVADHQLTVALDSTFDLTDAAAAHARGEQRSSTGKLVLRCG
jgi:NADPH:quinone reductase-like Zn-dependent oxidoreductase